VCLCINVQSVGNYNVLGIPITIIQCSVIKYPQSLRQQIPRQHKVFMTACRFQRVHAFKKQLDLADVGANVRYAIPAKFSKVSQLWAIF